MDFDDQLRRYFGTDDLSGVPQGALIAGIDRMRVDLGMEKDSGRRFAMWTLLYMLGGAPDLEVAFDNEADRDAARTFMEMTEEEDEES